MGRRAPGGPRAPGAVLRIEASLADVLGERLERSAPGPGGEGDGGGGSLADTDYLADTLARITLAMIRSAMIRHGRLAAGTRTGRRSRPANWWTRPCPSWPSPAAAT